MTAAIHTIPVERLRAAVNELMQGFGSAPREVELVADNLIQANLTGHDSHGVGMLPRYANAFLEGGLKANAPVLTRLDRGAPLALDGPAGFGQAVGHEAMALGIARAAAAWQLHRRARELAPLVPHRCLGVIAQGKTRVAHNKGERLAPGQSLDDHGEPTTDPKYGVVEPVGALRTFGEHKGFGLALVCELLGGALAGGLAAHDKGDGQQRVLNGMLTILFDPANWSASHARAGIR